MQSITNWVTPKTIPQLHNSEVHVWRILTTDFIEQLDQYWQLLNLSEQQQAKQFVQLKHQQRFIIIHGILRQILGHYLHINPTEINFINNEFGKPHISNELHNIHFNLSHSQDIALIAFTKNGAIGIDVEFRRQNIEIAEISKRFFTSNEADTINTAPAKQQLETFFTYWTCKEAFIKAIGEGLSYPLNKFEVDINNFKLHINDSKYQNNNWSLIKLDPYPNYSAALAIASETKPCQISTYALES